MEFIQSQKNKKILKYNGYIYRFNKKYKNTMYWKCNKTYVNHALIKKKEEIVKGQLSVAYNLSYQI